jgi:hypothetical protein
LRRNGEDVVAVIPLKHLVVGIQSPTVIGELLAKVSASSPPPPAASAPGPGDQSGGPSGGQQAAPPPAATDGLGESSGAIA